MSIQTYVYDAPFTLGCLFCKQPGLSGPVVSGQLWAGFGCHQVTWEIRLFSKPHQGGILQLTLSPNLSLESAAILPKQTLTEEYETRKVIINQIAEEVTPNGPSFKNQVLFSSYMSKEGSSVESSLSYTRLRGDRELRWKKWPPGEGTKSTDLLAHQASTPHFPTWLREKKVNYLQSITFVQICVFILGSYHEKNSKSSGIPQFKQL